MKENKLSVSINIVFLVFLLFLKSHKIILRFVNPQFFKKEPAINPEEPVIIIIQ